MTYPDANTAALSQYMAKQDAADAESAMIDNEVDTLMADEDERIDAVIKVIDPKADNEAFLLVESMIYGKTPVEREAARSKLDDLVRAVFTNTATRTVDDRLSNPSDDFAYEYAAGK